MTWEQEVTSQNSLKRTYQSWLQCNLSGIMNPLERLISKCCLRTHDVNFKSSQNIFLNGFPIKSKPRREQRNWKDYSDTLHEPFSFYHGRYNRMYKSDYIFIYMFRSLYFTDTSPNPIVPFLCPRATKLLGGIMFSPCTYVRTSVNFSFPDDNLRTPYPIALNFFV